MNFKILNEFGAEFTGSLTDIKAINTADNKVVTLNNNQLNTLNINRATRSGNVITASEKPLQFNNANSNAAAFISCLPDKLTYQGSINLNPLGNISAYNDFAYYNTGVRILADIIIPLKFSANYFSLQSDADIDFSEIKQLDNVKGGNFVILATNGYPFDARLQAYMLNAQNQVIDSLFINGANTLARGQLNSQNIVVSPSSSKIYVPVSTDKIANLKKCRRIRIITKVLVPPGPPDIEIRENYEFDINVVAELTYKIATSGN
ncbi:MAG: hypothetical protein IT236_17320 [Bacteroidia bacterium]|nr:hypothetical protein [Bacteroidia bacterium]